MIYYFSDFFNLNYFFTYFILTSISSLSIAFSIVVFLSENTIYSVFSLILAIFFSTTCLIFFGVEFLSIIYVMIYAGAVAVVFLFVIMFVNIRWEDTWVDLTNLKNNFFVWALMFKVYFLISLHLSLSINTFYSSKYNNKLFFVNSQKDFISLSLFNFEDIKIFSFFLYNQFSGFLFLFSLLLSFTLMAALYICLIFNTRKLS